MIKHTRFLARLVTSLFLLIGILFTVSIAAENNTLTHRVSEVVPYEASSTFGYGSQTYPSVEIDKLTQQNVVIHHVRQYQQLPHYYIKKSAARAQGWNPRSGNLCTVLPGKAIGGDRFFNRQGILPNAADRIWFEADINYRCGHRGAERLLYSNDGLLYVTRDHYKSFTEVKE